MKMLPNDTNGAASTVVGDDIYVLRGATKLIFGDITVYPKPGRA